MDNNKILERQVVSIFEFISRPLTLGSLSTMFLCEIIKNNF